MPDDEEHDRQLILAVWLNKDGKTWSFEVLPFLPDDLVIEALDEFKKAVLEKKLETKLTVDVNGQRVIEDKLPNLKPRTDGNEHAKDKDDLH